MEKITLSEWTAIYAAILSTLIVVISLLRSLLDGPRLAVTVFNPREYSIGNDRTFLAIISNIGSSPAVIQRLECSFRTSRWPWGKEIASAVFDESTRWKPSVKLVPNPNSTNSFSEQPNVLAPNDEIRAPAAAHSKYRFDRDWIRVSASPRNSKRRFVGWAAPRAQGIQQDQSEE